MRYTSGLNWTDDNRYLPASAEALPAGSNMLIDARWSGAVSLSIGPHSAIRVVVCCAASGALVQSWENVQERPRGKSFVPHSYR